MCNYDFEELLQLCSREIERDQSVLERQKLVNIARLQVALCDLVLAQAAAICDGKQDGLTEFRLRAIAKCVCDKIAERACAHAAFFQLARKLSDCLVKGAHLRTVRSDDSLNRRVVLYAFVNSALRCFNMNIKRLRLRRRSVGAAICRRRRRTRSSSSCCCASLLRLRDCDNQAEKNHGNAASESSSVFHYHSFHNCQWLIVSSQLIKTDN